MATYDSTQIGFILIGGNTVVGNTTAMTPPELSRVVEDTTPFGVASRAFTQTAMTDAMWGFSGIYDDTVTTGYDAVIQAGIGVANVAAISIQGNTVGKYCIGMQGEIVSNYKRDIAVGKLHKAIATCKLTGAMEDAVILFSHAAIATATSNGASQNNTASSANGGSAYFFCSALTLGGATNLVLKVQDSADNASFADLVAATVITAAPSGQRVTVAGTVRQYIRATLAYTGSPSGETATVMVAFFRG